VERVKGWAKPGQGEKSVAAATKPAKLKSFKTQNTFVNIHHGCPVCLSDA
jgi:hypothetical protein